jgi:hypothetical protein
MDNQFVGGVGSEKGEVEIEVEVEVEKRSSEHEHSRLRWCKVVELDPERIVPAQALPSLR